jgi:hypothetical protein
MYYKLVHWFIGSLVDWFIGSLVGSLVAYLGEGMSRNRLHWYCASKLLIGQPTLESC